MIANEAIRTTLVLVSVKMSGPGDEYAAIAVLSVSLEETAVSGA